MSGLNKVTLIGHLGADPETRRLNSGDPVVNMRIATSETWRDRTSGERKERTEWHNVVIFNEALCSIAEKYLSKGSKVYVEGMLQTRSWEKDGDKRYTTEIVLKNFNGTILMLDGKGDGDGDRRGGGRRDDRSDDRGRDRDRGDYGRESGGRSGGKSSRELDDEIPF